MKKYSHSIITKIVVFLIAIVCFTGVIKTIVEVEIVNDGDFNSLVEDNYFQSKAFVEESNELVNILTRLLVEFKNEEHIISGGTISEDDWRSLEQNLYSDFQFNSRSFRSKLSEGENYEIFKKEYADKIAQLKERMIKDELREFHILLQNLEAYKEPIFFASDGTNTFKNSKLTDRVQFENYPSYMIFEKYNKEIFPKVAIENEYLYRTTDQIDELDPENTAIYVAFSDEFLNQKIKEWKENKASLSKNLYVLAGFLIGFILSFIYLVLVIGRKSFKDKELNFHAGDKIYNDINIVICIGFVALWIAMVDDLFENIEKVITPITFSIATLVFLLILSLVKHFKNKTIIKHTLIYTLIYKLVLLIGDVYRSGSVGIKTVLIVIGYPILVAITFFMFPVTLGVAAWFANKKVKSFNAINEGVKRIKEGDILHSIEVNGKGEFAKLAANINSITDGLKNAVESELKSERLKTELITNVSHDIRTPLTSIITYVDLLKNEKNPMKVEEYVDVLDQKSKRLKILTDDLFEATKASSGNIPVNFVKIDIVSLINQGLGEVNDKIEALDLDFKKNFPKEKVYITADGKLLWRSIENILSNIFKYALRGSRVYISIEDTDNDILLTFKNISAYELNISADELMERFKRGDESRSSQGSGLGLSIAKSLIEIQKGKFNIQIDGDLFKAMIYLPKHKHNSK